MGHINSSYLLTSMTGKEAGTDRTTVIGTVEMKMRTFWIGVIALVPGAILAGIFFPLLNAWSLLFIAAVEGAAFWLIEKRAKDGLKLRTYQAMFDKKRSDVGTFYLCGTPIDVSGTQFELIRTSTAPAPERTVEDFFEFGAKA